MYIKLDDIYEIYTNWKISPNVNCVDNLTKPELKVCIEDYLTKHDFKYKKYTQYRIKKERIYSFKDIEFVL